LNIEKKIKECLEYRGGQLFWKSTGKRAGSKCTRGYRRIKVLGRRLQEHRVIFYLLNNRWPREMDHINRIPDDNRIENLRECYHWQNQHNRYYSKVKDGDLNVHRQATGNYAVRMEVRGRRFYFGTFRDKEFAQLVASEARDKYVNDAADIYKMDANTGRLKTLNVEY